jgi:hypothetical protein
MWNHAEPPKEASVSPVAATASPPGQVPGAPVRALATGPASGPSAEPDQGVNIPTHANPMGDPPELSPREPGRRTDGPPAHAASDFAPTFPVPPPARSSRPPGVRIAGEELIADLFEAMHELHFMRDAIEGGELCLTIGMSKLPSQAGLVHLYDIDRREFVVTNTRGSIAAALLGRRHPESDPMLAMAMRRRAAIVIAAKSNHQARTLERYTELGGAKSVLVAPSMQAGRFLGAIELFNPIDEQPFTDSDANALTYIAEQLADFVAARGALDSERIGLRRT